MQEINSANSELVSTIVANNQQDVAEKSQPDTSTNQHKHSHTPTKFK